MPSRDCPRLPIASLVYDHLMSKLHEYPVTVTWEGGRTGRGEVVAERSTVACGLAVPPEFGGNDQPGTNPEELLASAIASCYAITFGIISQNRKLPIKQFNVEAVGVVEESGDSFVYKQITIKPSIILEHDADDAAMKAASDFAHKADSYCIITNAVRGKVEIILDAKVEKA